SSVTETWETTSEFRRNAQFGNARHDACKACHEKSIFSGQRRTIRVTCTRYANLTFAMEADEKATRISLLTFATPQMRAFHMSWIAFFLCFFAWFGIAPLMSVVRDEMHFTKDQIGWCVIGSVAITIVARLVVGRLCDRFGPRLTYTWLLLVGSLPVMGI